MIEFSLQVESRIIQAILPELGKIYAASQRESVFPFVCPNPLDDDLVEAWENGLAEEGRGDREAVARLMSDPKFAHGRVAVPEAEAAEQRRRLRVAPRHHQQHRGAGLPGQNEKSIG